MVQQSRYFKGAAECAHVGFFWLVALVIAISATITAPAASASMFTVNVFPGLNGPLTDSSPVSASGVLGNPPGTFAQYGSASNYWSEETSAVADRGALETSAYGVTYFPDPMTLPGLWNGYATASASFTIDDLIFAGPGSTVSGSLRLELDGAFGANAGIFGSPHSPATATASVQVGASMAAPNFLVAGTGYAQSVAHEDGILPTTTTGLLTGYSGGPMLIEIPFVDAPVGTPITLSLSLVSGGSAALNAEGAFFKMYRAFAEGSSSYSFHFATSGGVFVLPPGYSADSPDGGIEDNQFGQPVPEPTSWALLAAGLTVLPWLRKIGAPRCGTRMSASHRAMRLSL